MSHQSPEQSLYTPGASANYTWSGEFTTSSPLPNREILRQLGALVTDYGDPLRPLSGTIMGLGNTLRQKIILGLDPSKTFGTPTIETCEGIAADITTRFGWERTRDENLAPMRSVIGKRIGYGGTAYVYGPMETYVKILNHQTANMSHAAGDLFSLRFIPGEGLRSYQEPGIIISAPANATDNLLRIANQLGQERLVTETTGQRTQVYQQA
jgi:hypothetical protein